MPTLADLFQSIRTGLNLLHGDTTSDYHSVQIMSQQEHSWLEPYSLRIVSEDASLKRISNNKPNIIIYPASNTQHADELFELCQKKDITLVVMHPSLSVERVKDAALKLLLKDMTKVRTQLGQIVSLQNYLLEGLESNKPERDILEKLHKLSNANFVLYSSWGTVLSQAGIINLNARVLNLEEGQHKLANSTLWVFKLAGISRMTLFATHLNDSFLPLMESVKQLLQLAEKQRQLRMESSQLQKEVLFNEWHLGNPHDLILRLASHNFDTGIDYMLIIAKQSNTKQSISSRQQNSLSLLKQKGDNFFSTLAIPFLSSQKESHIVWVINSSNTAHLRSLYEALNNPEGKLKLGSSLPNNNYSDLAKSYHQGILAADSAGNTGFANFSKLDPIYWTLQQQPKANLEALREQLIGKIKQSDKSGKLFKTLEAYLQHPDDLNSLADNLNVHVNTLRYRLSKIEKLIDKPLSKPETLAQLYLAQQIDRMLD